MFKNIVVRSSTGFIILNYTSPDQPNKCKFLPVYLVSSICGILGKPMHSALPYISNIKLDGVGILIKARHTSA